MRNYSMGNGESITSTSLFTYWFNNLAEDGTHVRKWFLSHVVSKYYCETHHIWKITERNFKNPIVSTNIHLCAKSTFDKSTKDYIICYLGIPNGNIADIDDGLTQKLRFHSSVDYDKEEGYIK